MNQTDDRLTAVASAYAAVFEDLAAATTGRTRRGPQGAVLAISGAPIAALNAIISPSPEPSAEEIMALAATEDPWDLPWSIHVRGIPGPLVTEAAALHGLTHFERQPLMVRNADQGLPPEPVIDGLRVRVAGVDELALYAEPWRKASRRLTSCSGYSPIRLWGGSTESRCTSRSWTAYPWERA
ncbi:hypothetical protein TUSST3_38350 [Streptomyces sp. TUS-ST3]|nr:hypothetical protein TUSST3_38350 [Streptomyces sp. TUS-ST3]